MSEFVGFLSPPGRALEGYDSKQLHTQQPKEIPEVFRQAMSVREEVYVEEQKVPLENEFDFDDARSYHWVAYASVGTPSSPEVQPAASSSSGQSDGRRKTSTANKLAVGTIRLVPPPHPPHPEPGSSHKIDNAEGVPADVDSGHGDKKTSDHGHEAYIKLGRLAVLKPYRGE